MKKCLSLIFVFCVLIVSIQCFNSPRILAFFVATNDFEYLEIGADGKEVLKNHSDKVLMVGTHSFKMIGSAQSYCRHINPPAEQIVLLSNSVFYPFVDGKIDKTQPVLPPPGHTCAAPSYGCLTLVHNYCSVPIDFNALKLEGISDEIAVLSKSQQKPETGSELQSIYLDQNGEIQEGIVKVKDFKECEDYFDPEKVYLVDKEEQICTSQIYHRPAGDRPIDLNNGLLFQKINDWNLIGIESKAGGNLSLSTFAPYHCQNFENKCSE